MRELSRACCAAFVFVLALLVALSDDAAQGQVPETSGHLTSGASDAVKALPTSIQAALNRGRDKGDLAPARQLLEQAYRTEKTDRRPLFLFFLGRVSATQGRRIDAADYYRRYLALVAPESSSRALWEEASRFLRAFFEPVAELQVRGPAGALLYVGTRLVGELPLPDTVFVPGGAHLFTLNYGNERYSTPNAKSFPAESISVVQLELQDASKLDRTVQRAALWLLQIDAPPGSSSTLSESINAAVSKLALEGNCVLVRPGRAADFMRQHPSLRRCVEQRDCSSPFISRDELAMFFQLQIKLAPDGHSYELALTALHIETKAQLGPYAGQGSATAIGQSAVALLGRVMGEIGQRERGRLNITSSPNGAQVWQDERLLDLTPYRNPTLAGPNHLRLTGKGYLPQELDISVEPGREATLAVTLKRAPWQGFGGRPLWRVALSGSLLFAGVVVGGFGVSALVANGTCGNLEPVEGDCQFLETGTIGTALFTTGAAVAALGTVLLAWPGSRPPKSVRTAALR